MGLKLAVCSLGLFLAGAEVRGADVTVFAAASLADALAELKAGYEADTGDRLTVSTGASSTLARQIVEGAPADVFFSADEAQMDTLQTMGLVVAATRRSVLSNALVVVVGRDDESPISSPAALTNAAVTRVALADPEAVPAGVYAKAYLERQGLWAALAPKVIPLEHVRAALIAVETGNADAAIVYRTDALRSQKVRVAYAVPPGEAPAITYPAAVLRDAKDFAAAQRFVAYLKTPAATGAFTRQGFVVLVH